MRALVVEDDTLSRMLLQKILGEFGECDIAINGFEALNAFKLAHERQQPYELICLDIMMPEMDGHEVLKKIRMAEERQGIKGLAGVKIIMTTALKDRKNIMDAFRQQCEAYLVKPIDKQKLYAYMQEFGLVKA